MSGITSGCEITVIFFLSFKGKCLLEHHLSPPNKLALVCPVDSI